MVVGHEGDGTTTRVVAQDPDRPEIGSITLVFTGDPVELRQWIITDEGGGQTTVILVNPSTVQTGTIGLSGQNSLGTTYEFQNGMSLGGVLTYADYGDAEIDNGGEWGNVVGEYSTNRIIFLGANFGF